MPWEIKSKSIWVDSRCLCLVLELSISLVTLTYSLGLIFTISSCPWPLAQVLLHLGEEPASNIPRAIVVPSLGLLHVLSLPHLILCISSFCLKNNYRWWCWWCVWCVWGGGWGVQGQSILDVFPQLLSTFTFWDRSSSWISSSLVRTTWLLSFRICLSSPPNAIDTGTCRHHARLFTWVLHTLCWLSHLPRPSYFSVHANLVSLRRSSWSR